MVLGPSVAVADLVSHDDIQGQIAPFDYIFWGSSEVLLICAKDLFVEAKQTAAATFRSLEPWRPYPPLVRYAEITA